MKTFLMFVFSVFIAFSADSAFAKCDRDVPAKKIISIIDRAGFETGRFVDKSIQEVRGLFAEGGSLCGKGVGWDRNESLLIGYGLCTSLTIEMALWYNPGEKIQGRDEVEFIKALKAFAAFFPTREEAPDSFTCGLKEIMTRY